MATVEIAVALPALAVVALAAMWGIHAASVQLDCTDAARSGARAAARGESLPAVRALVVRALPAGATVEIRRDAETTRIRVSVPVKAPAPSGLPPLTIRADAAAATEPGVEGGGRSGGFPGDAG